MCDYCGEDLLKVFKDLNVSLLNLNPNVIKAWFDTDDTALQNLLAWMCASLSKENFVPPLESAEFLEIKTPLVGEKYQQELRNIEELYPGIFDAEFNALEIELLEDEIELALEEEKQLDELIGVNKVLENSLSKDLSVATSKEIKSAVQLKSMQELCNALSEKLDEVNVKLHLQLEKYGSNLYNFEFGAVRNFINNMDVKECQDNFDNVIGFLAPLLKNESMVVNLPQIVVTATNQTSSEPLFGSESITSTLNTMKTSIFLQMNREGKEQMKRRLCGMLDDISEKLAEHHIAQTKLKYAQQELELYQLKLDSVNKIEEVVLKFLSQFPLLYMLCVLEKNDIDNSDQFYRKILDYINKDLQNCALRTEKMDRVIEEYGVYASKGFGERCRIVKLILNVLTGGKDLNLCEAIGVIEQYKSELNILQNKLFYSDFYNHKRNTKELKDNVDILQSFLTCGPTHRIVVVPRELLEVLRQVEDHLKKQHASVTSAVEVCSTMKKSTR
ncbi:hypothetical protein NQ315_007263 [Exocentrus adspersus]|uniref:HAUS augmin-like complex subunit 3 N-terminal domain-containing protein n=1 Tax=Exocentrus adspersus TaxID=1586481 RepID=A0AAV8WDD5_9CUCU|nr:hypothetical protein NQ315_007263 [Exocentrus adspersus]